MFPFDFFADFLTRNSLTRFFSFFLLSEAEVNFLFLVAVSLPVYFDPFLLLLLLGFTGLRLD